MLVAHGIEGRKTEVLKLYTNIVHAQALREGGIDFQGFAGDAAAFIGSKYAEGAHVVQAVCQLDQDDANISGHGQGHFLKIFGLLLGFRGKFNFAELADAVNQF